MTPKKNGPRGPVEIATEIRRLRRTIYLGMLVFFAVGVPFFDELGRERTAMACAIAVLFLLVIPILSVIDRAMQTPWTDKDDLWKNPPE